MAQWGKTDQAPTANSTTTKLSSTGAPLYVADLFNKGGGDTAAYGNTSGSRAANAVNMFDNVTPGAFVNGMAVGVFGVDAVEQGVNGGKTAHAGWNLRKVGTGSLLTLSYTGTATGYSNTDVVTVASSQAGGNATASISTNSTGGALTLTITNAGRGFTSKDVSASVSVANSTGGASAGSGATFVATAGGRAGRVTYETLVAMGSITGDGSDDTQFPDS
jgi:hypothetical protein